MNLYLAWWPDKSTSIVSADDIFDLFWTLDEEGNPYEAKAIKLKMPVRISTLNEDDGFRHHVTKGGNVVDFRKHTPEEYFAWLNKSLGVESTPSELQAST